MDKKSATCFATVLQNESVISDVARFTTHENKPNCNLIIQGSYRSWKAMKFTNFVFQAWKVMEFNCRSWRVMENESFVL